MTKEEYNNEPVTYCVNCLDLGIKKLDDIDLDVCRECGNVDFKETDIDTWNKLYTKRYHKLFLTRDED